MKQPFLYQGSKVSHLDILIPMIPDHECFIEVFGGSGSLLLNKDPSDYEIYNDFDEYVWNFFKVLRDKPRELIKKLELTPYSRKEYKYNVNSKADKRLSAVEKARRWYMVQAISFSGRYGAGIRSVNFKDSFVNFPKRFSDRCRYLEVFARRLSDVMIENLSFEKLIEKYDKEASFFYLDPPYLGATKNDSTVYDEELTEEQHELLVDCLVNLKGKGLLSCYDHEIYDRLLDNGWKKSSYHKMTTMDRNDIRDREETIYFNYKLDGLQRSLL